jgi:hypothetical protein
VTQNFLPIAFLVALTVALAAPGPGAAAMKPEVRQGGGGAAGRGRRGGGAAGRRARRSGRPAAGAAAPAAGCAVSSLPRQTLTHTPPPPPPTPRPAAPPRQIHGVRVVAFINSCVVFLVSGLTLKTAELKGLFTGEPPAGARRAPHGAAG